MVGWKGGKRKPPPPKYATGERSAYINIELLHSETWLTVTDTVGNRCSDKI